jgi:hypothetical protein
MTSMMIDQGQCTCTACHDVVRTSGRMLRLDFITGGFGQAHFALWMQYKSQGLGVCCVLGGQSQRLFLIDFQRLQGSDLVCKICCIYCRRENLYLRYDTHEMNAIAPTKCEPLFDN